MRISKDRVVRTVVLVAAAALLSACNTVKGLGKDIHYAGEKTEEALSK
jgi:predicted small secreted protein